MSIVNRLSVGNDSAAGAGAGLGAGLEALSLLFLKNGSATEYAGVGRGFNA
jgi:hypothetical protein